MQAEGFADAESDQTRRSGVFLTTNAADFVQRSPMYGGTDGENISSLPVNLLLCR